MSVIPFDPKHAVPPMLEYWGVDLIRAGFEDVLRPQFVLAIDAQRHPAYIECLGERRAILPTKIAKVREALCDEFVHLEAIESLYFRTQLVLTYPTPTRVRGDTRRTVTPRLVAETLLYHLCRRGLSPKQSSFAVETYGGIPDDELRAVWEPYFLWKQQQEATLGAVLSALAKKGHRLV